MYKNLLEMMENMLFATLIADRPMVHNIYPFRMIGRKDYGKGLMCWMRKNELVFQFLLIEKYISMDNKSLGAVDTGSRICVDDEWTSIYQ